jgi:hypothetical protein
MRSEVPRIADIPTIGNGKTSGKAHIIDTPLPKDKGILGSLSPLITPAMKGKA